MALVMARRRRLARGSVHLWKRDVTPSNALAIADSFGVGEAARAALVDQQDGPQRCARHGADDAGGALPPGACQDVTQSKTADAADPSPTASVEGDRHRKRP